MLGTLTLEGHTGYAYQHLWNAISRTGTALLAGLLVFTLVISWVCNRLLRPLEQINQQLVKIRKRQFSGNLASPGCRISRSWWPRSTSWCPNENGICCNSGSR